jgi:hypothetical protein
LGQAPVGIQCPLGRVSTSGSATFASAGSWDRLRRTGQLTILDECWKPAFARSVFPRHKGLKAELDRYLGYYNNHRAHTGRWNRGRTPVEVIGKAKMYSTR